MYQSDERPFADEPGSNQERGPGSSMDSPKRHSSPRRRNSRSPMRTPSPKRNRSRSPKRSTSGSPRRTRSRSPSDRENPPPAKVLGVFGLSPHTRQEQLQDIFKKYGEIEKIDLIIDRQTQRSKCFGFIYFYNVEDARKAKEDCNGMNIHGRNIRTDFSYTLKPHSPTPGKYMGRPSKGSRRNVDRYEPYEYRSRRYEYRDRGYDDRYPRYERERGSDRYERDRYDRYERDRERYDHRSYDRDRSYNGADDRYDYRDRYYDDRYDRHRR